jgi:hypothetical protein
VSFLWGQSQRLSEAEREDRVADIQEDWADQYGSVFVRPGPLGTRNVVVTDPKAVAHIYAGLEVRTRAYRRTLTLTPMRERLLTATQRSAHARSPGW